jgi:hypothetical protein
MGGQHSEKVVARKPRAVKKPATPGKRSEQEPRPDDYRTYDAWVKARMFGAPAKPKVKAKAVAPVAPVNPLAGERRRRVKDKTKRKFKRWV